MYVQIDVDSAKPDSRQRTSSEAPVTFSSAVMESMQNEWQYHYMSMATPVGCGLNVQIYIRKRTVQVVIHIHLTPFQGFRNAEVACLLRICIFFQSPKVLIIGDCLRPEDIYARALKRNPGVDESAANLSRRQHLSLIHWLLFSLAHAS